MPRQKRIKSSSGFYHIMLRGNAQQDIFHDDIDRQYFLDILFSKKLEGRFFLLAYCLMNNHIHLMVREGMEDISEIIKKITVSYVSYYNKKYKRVGHLFQDRFKSEAVENDSYVLALVRYIHNNPVKAKMVNNISDYKWSSYNNYLNDSYSSKIIEKDLVLDLLSLNRQDALNAFKDFMNEESEDSFIDIEEVIEAMDEEEAKDLFEKIIKEHGIENRKKTPDELIREFREKTRLPIREIALITGLDKNRINKAIKS